MGESEAEQLVRLTDAQLRYGDVAWLEVGAGNGRNLRLQIEGLATNRRIRAVAIEPFYAGQSDEAIEWVRVRAEKYEADRRFDWVNVRHSAYYIVNLVAELTRISQWLSRDGSIALTHWSRDCILRRLHVATCGDDEQAATLGIEDLVCCLKATSKFDVSSVTISETALDVSAVLDNTTLAAALFRLTCRGRLRRDTTLDPANQITALLRRSPNNSSRRNGIVIVRPIK